MPAEQDRIKAMTFDRPEYIPVGVGILPATWMRHREQLDALVRRHPAVFGSAPPGPRDYDAVGGTYAAGEHVDEWGCVWSNVRSGMEAIVTGHPVPRREMVRSFRPPQRLTGRHPHGFMFLRLFDLRGFEEMMVDFAEEPPELQMLIDLVLGHNLRNLQLRLKEERGPIIYFGDDNGMQTSLPISPAKWRKYIKPAYAKLYGRCREAGLHVYMHTDGCVWEVVGDLIDCGVEVLNLQYRANGLDNLVRTCKGKVCLNLDLDRQMFPFATPGQIDAHVRQCVEALGSPEGGLWLSAECGPDVPLENIEAICAALEKYRGFFRGGQPGSPGRASA